MPVRYCFALDLKEDASLIAEYDAWHQRVWPEIAKSIGDAGIESMEIYRVHTRLFMMMEVNEFFSFEKKDAQDKASAKVQEWETLMWKYQQALPFAKPGEKWVRMDKIFDLRHF
jgi:L-rhamnose mutarotase